MNRGDFDRAKRRALNILDKWLDCTGAIPEGYRDEIEGVVEDAVEVGVQAALGVKEPLAGEEDA